MDSLKRYVEKCHHQSLEQILRTNGKYMCESSKHRISNGADIMVMRHDQESRGTGSYQFNKGRSVITVCAIDPQQIEMSTVHETNHFASIHDEIKRPHKNGYFVEQTIGLRKVKWYFSEIIGRDIVIASSGRGINEGITTMYTIKQLMDKSNEKGLYAEQQGIYEYVTSLSRQLEVILGEELLKDAYYGGKRKELKLKMNHEFGEDSYNHLLECMDKVLSPNSLNRTKAMKQAHEIMSRKFQKNANGVTDEFVFDFILERIVRRNRHGIGPLELEALKTGISRFLLDYGIGLRECEEYYKSYVVRQLSFKVQKQEEILSYFVHYPIICDIGEIVVHHQVTGKTEDKQRVLLNNMMDKLRKTGMEKYVPSSDISSILNEDVE